MSFTSQMNAFCKQIAPDKLDSTVRKTVIEIGNRVIQRSPVGDATLWQSPPPPGYVGGRFRANWMYGYNSMREVITDQIDPSGMVSLTRILGVASWPSAGIHYITNSLPYAQRLEDGWSSQAPGGMVSLVEIEFSEIARRAAL
jgi:hypothetical protein